MEAAISLLLLSIIAFHFLLQASLPGLGILMLLDCILGITFLVNERQEQYSLCVESQASLSFA